MRRPVTLALAAALFAGLLFAPAPQQADARPKHLAIFAKHYAETLPKDVVDKTKCNVCHEPTQKSKKFRNAYGLELSKILTENEKDEAKVLEALDKVAKEKSCVEKKTYGDLIKDGKLPAEGCEPVKED